MQRMKRILLSTVAAVMLVVLLAATAYALGWIYYKVENNYFKTGDIEVSIIRDLTTDKYEVNLFSPDSTITVEPGATICGDFTIQNGSNDPNGIWYRIHFSNVQGELADVLVATLRDESGNPVKSGSMKSWTSPLFMDAEGLGPGGSCGYTLELHHPEEAGNDTQNLSMSFDLSVTAVQRSNNPDKLFG